MEFKIDKKELAKTGKFLIWWVLLFLVIYYIIIALAGWQALEGITAFSSEKVLKSFGVLKIGVDYSQSTVLMSVEGKRIEISELCTGMLETVLLFTAILASFGISWKKRIFGACGALIFGFAFNQLRIFVSIMQILSTEIQIAELTHDFFFRLSLLIVIAGYYYLWFKKATKKGQLTKQKQN